MKIKTRLLLLFLPALLAVVLTLSFLSYLTWHHELVNHSKATLETVVTSAANLIDPETQEWIFQHRKDSGITKDARYKKYVQALKSMSARLPVTSIYTVKIEPVAVGEAVLRDRPLDENNRVNMGDDESLAYRQIYILDSEATPGEPLHLPGDEDFSESGEIKVYATKLPFVSPIYEAKATGVRMMTAYAPIFDKNENVTSLVAADLSLGVIDRKARQSQGLIFIGGLVTVLLIMACAAIVTNNISQPIEQLKNAALSLAAGNYGKKVELEGAPKEIAELANTVNTMSECLREHLAKLEESSILREKMIGEIECIRILESKFVDAIADRFYHPSMRIKAVGIQGRTPHKTTTLEIFENEEKRVRFIYKESNFIGFDGIYELVTGKKDIPFCELILNKTNSSQWNLSFYQDILSPPLIWQPSTNTMAVCDKSTQLGPNDFVIITNATLEELIKGEDSLHNWFSRVFRHFGEEGLDACSTLLMNEFTFLAQRHEVQTPLQAICLQIQGGD